MTERHQQLLSLLAILAVIGGAIYYLDSHKPGGMGTTTVTELTPDNMPAKEKSQKLVKAKELVNPAGFINTDSLRLQDLVGKQIILVDFWTYSCINCQRTLPYLNAWQEKYGDQGLTIVGVHTPEFAFEQLPENVQAAVDKYQIQYPVVLDNDYATWKAYGNRYWPRKYLIDLDGYIVYDHIGEGAYEETERQIQLLLQERAKRLEIDQTISPELTGPQPGAHTAAEVGSPEVYFGSRRNELLRNGAPFRSGPQDLPAPAETPLNQLFLIGQWDIQPEYAGAVATPATIKFRYRAREVYMVASAAVPVTVQVLRDGQPVGSVGGEDVTQRGNDSVVTIKEDRLYKLIEDADGGEHTLELRVESPGFKAFTFTFG